MSKKFKTTQGITFELVQNPRGYKSVNFSFSNARSMGVFVTGGFLTLSECIKLKNMINIIIKLNLQEEGKDE